MPRPSTLPRANGPQRRRALGLIPPLLALGCAAAPKRPITPATEPPVPVKTHSAPENDRVGKILSDGQRCTGALAGEQRVGEWRCFHSDGRLLGILNYRDGRLEGKVEFFFEDGRPDTVSEWQDGKLHGRHLSYHRDGYLETECGFDRGLLDGRLAEYAPDGQLLSERHYRSGNLHGEARTWHRNGRLRSRGLYRDGAQTGAWQRFDESGRPLPDATEE